MDSVPADPSAKSPERQPTAPVDSGSDTSARDVPSKLSSWARSFKIPQQLTTTVDDCPTGGAGKSTFSRFTSGFGLRSSPKSPPADEGHGPEAASGFIGTITKGLVDTSKNAVKVVQVKARHAVSQNKRRYQDGGFDLDMTYITENIIAMGFPAGDMSSGFFGFVEGFYRNHMEEVIKFFEMHHKDKYKVYNLCSERLYDASLFEGKVASFPFDDHNCPPIQLIISFCHSAYSWLKEDIENVVVVHCKAGMARTGLMISSLLLYLKFFPTAEESIDYYNQKRCFDGKGLVLPSQIRYVKYFERTLTYFNGENQPGRRCMLRGFRLHRCPYWIRPAITVSDHNVVNAYYENSYGMEMYMFDIDSYPRMSRLHESKVKKKNFYMIPMSIDDCCCCFVLLQVFSFLRKSIRGPRTCRQKTIGSVRRRKELWYLLSQGSPVWQRWLETSKSSFMTAREIFTCLWLNTTMMENRKVLNTGDIDGFDKRKLPSPGFQVEVVLVDANNTTVLPVPLNTPQAKSDGGGSSTVSTTSPDTASAPSTTAPSMQSKDYAPNPDKDDVFSDSEAEESVSSKRKGDEASAAPQATTAADVGSVATPATAKSEQQAASLTKATEQVSLGNAASEKPVHISNQPKGENDTSSIGHNNTESEFKAMAADASVFTFGDDEDYDSE
ncbi:unnamed protein product [Linum tenue]|uniref:Uncharacterized protein n=1 Tax=Linum tenue TaxID=586396 RepID=A0AAV0MI54_9ROSI|nr:unnamed protein product [Linum tenue]